MEHNRGDPPGQSRRLFFIVLDAFLSRRLFFGLGVFLSERNSARWALVGACASSHAGGALGAGAGGRRCHSTNNEPPAALAGGTRAGEKRLCYSTQTIFPRRTAC